MTIAHEHGAGPAVFDVDDELAAVVAAAHDRAEQRLSWAAFAGEMLRREGRLLTAEMLADLDALESDEPYPKRPPIVLLSWTAKRDDELHPAGWRRLRSRR